MNTLNIKIKQDFRSFTEGEEFEVPIKQGLNFIVGPNKSGKSTIFHYIRAQKNSMDELMLGLRGGMTLFDDLTLKNAPELNVTGYEGYDYVFSLDSVDDDPSSMINTATCTGFLYMGGLNAQSESRGQKALNMFWRFVGNMVKTCGLNPEDVKKGKTLEDKRCLILIDEIDDGFDLGNQKLFLGNLKKTVQIFNADILCITHNLMTILLAGKGSETEVFDMADKQSKTIGDYIKEQTGMEMIVKTETK